MSIHGTLIAAAVGGTVVGTAAVLRRSIMYIVIFTGTVMVINSFKGDISAAYQAHLKSRETLQQAQTQLQLEQQRLNLAARKEQLTSEETRLRLEIAVKQEQQRLQHLKEQAEREARIEERMTRKERAEYLRRREAQRQAAAQAEQVERERQARQQQIEEIERNMAVLDNLVKMQNARRP